MCIAFDNRNFNILALVNHILQVQLKKHFPENCVNLENFSKNEFSSILTVKKTLQNYQTEHNNSPPIPRKRASRSGIRPSGVDTITMPVPPKIRKISL